METAPAPQLFPTSFIPPDPLSSNTIPPPPPHKSPNPFPAPPPPSSDPTPPPCQHPFPAVDLPPPPPEISVFPSSEAAPPPPSTAAQPLQQLYSHRVSSTSVSIPPSAPSSTTDPPPPPPSAQPQLHNPFPLLPRHQRPSSSSDQKGPAPPPQQLSYAQAARSSRGPSFVRAHAKEVESFAKIPRTGVNIICGSKEGLPSFSFVSADLPKVEELYSNALVMKFLGGRPSLETSHKEIMSWGIEHPFSIGPLTSRAFLLRFQSNIDLLKVLTRPSSMLITFPYKVFRWHNLCHLKEDSCLAPVWISLPRLPLQCFIPEFLEAVGNKIGRFLCFDKATTTLARPSTARICVELDLRKSPPESIWVGLFDGFRQPLIYERMPKFCNGCHVLGHLSAACTKSQPVPPPPPSANQAKIPPSRTQPVRQNAPMHSSAIQQEKPIPNSTLVASSSLSTLAQPPPPISSSNTIQPDQLRITPQGDADMALRAKPSHQGSSSALSNPPGETPTDIGLPIISIRNKHSVRHRHSKGKQKRKSVSFGLPSAQNQSNLIANQNYWDAVNRQVALLEQARINPLQPSTSIPPGLPKQSTVDLAPTPLPVPSNIAQSAEDSSGSSIAADSQPNSPTTSIQDAQNPVDAFISNRSNTYDSEGEVPIVEPPGIEGHETDGALSKRPHSSKRNKRHPDQPLKVQLRVRKDPNSTFLC